MQHRFFWSGVLLGTGTGIIFSGFLIIKAGWTPGDPRLNFIGFVLQFVGIVLGGLELKKKIR